MSFQLLKLRKLDPEKRKRETFETFTKNIILALLLVKRIVAKRVQEFHFPRKTSGKWIYFLQKRHRVAKAFNSS